MKIERFDKKKVTFASIGEGEVFEYSNQIFMKTISFDGKKNYVSLEDGSLWDMPLHEMVTPLKAKLVFE